MSDERAVKGYLPDVFDFFVFKSTLSVIFVVECIWPILSGITVALHTSEGSLGKILQGGKDYVPGRSHSRDTDHCGGIRGASARVERSSIIRTLMPKLIHDFSTS